MSAAVESSVVRSRRTVWRIAVLSLALGLQVSALLGRGAPTTRDLVRPGFYDLVEVAYTGFPGEPPAHSRADWLANTFEGEPRDPGPAGLHVEVSPDRNRALVWHMDTGVPAHDCPLEFVTNEEAAALSVRGGPAVWLEKGEHIRGYLVFVPEGVWWVMETTGSESKRGFTHKYERR